MVLMLLTEQTELTLLMEDMLKPHPVPTLKNILTLDTSLSETTEPDKMPNSSSAAIPPDKNKDHNTEPIAGSTLNPAMPKPPAATELNGQPTPTIT